MKTPSSRLHAERVTPAAAPPPRCRLADSPFPRRLPGLGSGWAKCIAG